MELAARAVNIADMSARLRQMEDDLHSVDTLKKQIEDLPSRGRGRSVGAAPFRWRITVAWLKHRSSEIGI